ncbi:hypothetical protein Btru_008323 [Bulinus truncatus]|nr:hypothetical protein Btru_008323 [Bulinus truncatus]
MLIFMCGRFLHVSPACVRNNNYVKLLRKLTSYSLAKSFTEHQCQSSILKPLMMVSQTFCTSSRHFLCYPCSKRFSSEKLLLKKSNSSLNYSTEQKNYTEKTFNKELNESSHGQKDECDLKSVLEEIKNDFIESTNTPSETLNPTGESLDKKSLDSPELKKAPTLQSGNWFDSTTNASEFQYDYQVAEDIEEYDYKDEREIAQQLIRPEKIVPISLIRGQTGVFDLDELLVLLNHLGAEDVVTVPIPFEANFCDHMVIASAKSKRHLNAINEEFLWIHKRKKSAFDPSLNVEGRGKSDWSAMDLGNIVLHVFYGEAREYYDIESLWTLGPEHDPKCKEQNTDLSALSAENLFWLEASKTNKCSTEDKSENIQEKDADWESSKTS